MDKLKQDHSALRFWQITAALMTGLAEFDYNLDAQTKDHSSSIKIRCFQEFSSTGCKFSHAISGEHVSYLAVCCLCLLVAGGIQNWWDVQSLLGLDGAGCSCLAHRVPFNSTT